MKKVINSILLICLFSTIAFSQKESKYWHFGNKAGISFPYNNTLPTAITTSQLNSFEGVASISDGAGNLLFYTDGTQVWDKSDAVMPNGIGLAGSPSSSQSAIIVPVPGNSNRYYIFTTCCDGGLLKYSTVDMTIMGNATIGNPATGDVISSSKNTTAPGQSTGTILEKLTAIQKPDLSGYYVAVIQRSQLAVGFSYQLLIYEVNFGGITLLNNPVPVLGLVYNDLIGYMKFSPDASKLAIACWGYNRVVLFNFNPTNGQATNQISVTDSTYLNKAYGVEFSPDSKLLYTTCEGQGSTRYLNQFDLSTWTGSGIKSTRTLIYSYTPPGGTGFGFGALQLGPDNRIYVARGGESNLTYIDSPNNLGIGCGYTSPGISLAGNISYMGLPNYIPNFTNPNIKTCDIFKLDPNDTNCCSAGISRIYAGNSNVTKITYQVTGGVIQGYSASCAGTPSSTSLSGTASGTINFNPTCSLQLFNTSLQSTTSTGNMTVKYTVKFQNGDSCVYTTEVKGCPRSPLVQCDKVKGEICVCNPGSAGQNYLNLTISNQAIPASSICGLIINYYNSSNILDNGFFVNSTILSNYQVNPLPGPINVTGMLGTAAGTMNPFIIQANYTSNKVLDGRVEVITIHCNGDTCKTSWQPKKTELGDVIYIDWKPKFVKSPYSKVNAYSFKVAGPSASKMEPNPFKLKYLTINIPDSSGGPEIIGLTGSELYSVKGREHMLTIESASHAKYTALFKLKSALNMGPADTTGIFQVFFANGIPKNAFFNFYNEEGSMLSSSTLALDTSLGTGVTQLGKNGFGSNQMMLFSGYPNPTSDQFNLSISMVEAEEVKLTIMDINGRLIEEKNMGKVKRGLSELNINLAHLNEGTYFIQAITNNNYQLSNAIKVVVIK